MGALSGVRVVDLSRILAGPHCSQTLADHGADVIKIEPPGGDETRGWGPPFEDGESAYFRGLNRGKRGLALDLARAPGRDILLRLLGGADVLVENFKAGTLERWGLGYEEVLQPRHPRLIHCRISGFGGDGPLGGLPGYDAVAQAMSGLMAINGPADGPPVRIGAPVADLAAAMIAVQGIAMALYERERSGRGQGIEVSLLDAALGLLHPHAANYLMSGRRPGRTGSAHPNIAPYDLFATATAPVFLAIGKLTGIHVTCKDFRVHSVTVGQDAQGEVTVQVQHQNELYRGRGVSTDSVEASAKAFLNAINRIESVRNDERPPENKS